MMIEQANMTKSYVALATEIGKMNDGRSVTKAITRSVRGGRLCSSLVLLCKTHKGDGEVSFRNVHASNAYAFGGLSRWVTSQLRHMTAGFTQLLAVSKAFVDSIMSDPLIDENAYFVKIDIKDYYMSGTSDQLSEDASFLTNGHHRETSRSAMLCLLSSQWVVSSCAGHDDRSWSVHCGSGMGLPFSGDIADAAFLVRCEVDWACVPSILAHHGILRYRRFKDDTLLICTSRRHT